MGIADTLKKYGILFLGIIVLVIGVIVGAVGAFKRGYNNVDTTNVKATTNMDTGTSTISGVVVGNIWRYMFWGGLVLVGVGIGLLLGGLVLAVVVKPVVAVVTPKNVMVPTATRRHASTIV